MEAETELPRNAVRRLVKGKLDALAAGAEANFSVNKEVRGPGRRGCRCGRFPPPRGGFALSRLRGRAGLRAWAPLAGLPGGSGRRSPSRPPPRPRCPPPHPPPPPLRRRPAARPRKNAVRAAVVAVP